MMCDARDLIALPPVHTLGFPPDNLLSDLHKLPNMGIESSLECQTTLKGSGPVVASYPHRS